MNTYQVFYNIYLKRLLDIILTLLSLPAAIIIGALIACIIKLEDRGPVFYVQTRSGARGKEFKIFKFRTMRVGTPSVSTEEMTQLGLSPVTNVGKILRRMSVDELPQLLNVIKGEMSFVGPRPALPSQTLVLALRRSSGVDVLRPGITGLAQVEGRDDLDDQTKVKKDTSYLKELSLSTDLSLLYRTGQAVFYGSGTR